MSSPTIHPPYHAISKEPCIVLSPFRNEYVTDRYLGWFSDIEVTKYTSHNGMSAVNALQYIKSLGTDNMAWSIFELKPGNSTAGTHIGNVALQSISRRNRTGEFAIIVGDRDYWGKGITTLCLRWVIKTAFTEQSLNRVWLGTAKDNVGMIKAAMKCGMKHEGTLREHLFCNGQFMDCEQYGILTEEWDAGQES